MTRLLTLEQKVETLRDEVGKPHKLLRTFLEAA
jgi:hypothetical protein